MTKAKLELRRKQNPSAGIFAKENWQVDPNHASGVRPEVEAAFAELVKQLDLSDMSNRATNIDAGKKDGYWSRIIERSARSFESYTKARVESEGYSSDYLVNINSYDQFVAMGKNPEKYPYLKDTEIPAITTAFDRLFNTLKTKKTDQGVMLFSKSKVKKFNREYKTTNKAVDTEIPLVVLVNGSSASASEIVSGSLQDLDRAVIMGARSFGKGLVQRPLKLTYGTQLKVTISRYYTSSGRCIQALDYWNRDDNGDAVRNTKFNDFTTRNGRKVQDGGGVLPDLEVAAVKTNDLTMALLQNNVIFDYATNYHYQNNLGDISDFKFTNSDFNTFKDYVRKSNFSFETKAEEAIKKALSGEENDFLGTDVKDSYKTLLANIEKGKINALDKFQGEIQKNLEDEIVKRYFYRDGLYQYYLTNDDAILAATELLSNTAKYTGILN